VPQIPKVIHALWLQGVQAAPPLVKLCLGRWQSLNPDYRMIIHDRQSLQETLPNFPFNLSLLNVQALSDIFRVYLLKTNGGVWVDATTFPVQPLAAWLDDHAHHNFFAFTGHRPPLEISSWFLASSTDCALTQAWWQGIVGYWDRRRYPITFRKEDGGFSENYKQIPATFFTPEARAQNQYPYYWVMYLFTDLLDKNPELRQLWDKVPKRDARAAHAVVWGLRDEPDMPDDQLRQAFRREVLQKLNWRNEVLVARSLVAGV
jgi:Capsular polysaccharide synthesis protein